MVSTICCFPIWKWPVHTGYRDTDPNPGDGFSGICSSNELLRVKTGVDFKHQTATHFPGILSQELSRSMTTVVMLMMLNGSIGLYLRTARESPGGKKKMLLHQKVRRYLNYIYIYIYRKDTFPCGPTSTLCTPIEWYTLYKDVRACVFKLFWTCTITYGCQTKRERERNRKRKRKRKERKEYSSTEWIHSFRRPFMTMFNISNNFKLDGFGMDHILSWYGANVESIAV